MVENAGTDDLIEVCVQIADAVDRQLAELEIVQAIFLLECFGAAHARGAEVDAGDLGQGPAQRVLRCLRGAAAGNQDGVIVAVGRAGPEEMMVGATAIAIVPETSIAVEGLDRRGIRIPFVEVLDVGRHAVHYRASVRADTRAPADLSPAGDCERPPVSGLITGLERCSAPFPASRAHC